MRLMQDYCVADLISKEVVTATVQISLKEVVKTLHSKRFSSLVVLDEDKPVGIITERDLVRILADMLDDDAMMNQPVSHFMTSPIKTVVEDVSLFNAVKESLSHSIRHVPVVNKDGELVGLLTQTDIVKSLCDAGNVSMASKGNTF